MGISVKVHRVALLFHCFQIESFSREQQGYSTTELYICFMIVRNEALEFHKRVDHTRDTD